MTRTAKKLVTAIGNARPDGYGYGERTDRVHEIRTDTWEHCATEVAFVASNGSRLAFVEFLRAVGFTRAAADYASRCYDPSDWRVP